MDASDGPTVEELNGEVNLPPPPSLQRLLAQMLIDLAKQPKDIWRVTAPAALLNGVSLLEYSQHYGDHPLLLAAIAEQPSPADRMVACVKWYISTLFGSYASRSGGQEGGYERKPYNPILGEQFLCNWNQGQPAEAALVAEQVSHHPPVSVFYITTKTGVHVHGFTGQSTSFNGTGIRVRQEGRLFVFIESCNEEITITLPELHLFGLASAPYLEITGSAYLLSTSGWAADLDFEKSGYLYGGPDNLTGVIYNNDTGRDEAEVWGNWKKDVFLAPCLADSNGKKKKKRKSGQLLFSHGASPAQRPNVRSLEQQGRVESRRVWSTVTRALKRGDYEAAGEAKNRIEEEQRRMRREQEAGQAAPYTPALFSFTTSFHFLPFTENSPSVLDLDSVSTDSSSSLSSTSAAPYNGRWLCKEFVRKYNVKL